MFYPEKKTQVRGGKGRRGAAGFVQDYIFGLMMILFPQDYMWYVNHHTGQHDLYHGAGVQRVKVLVGVSTVMGIDTRIKQHSCCRFRSRRDQERNLRLVVHSFYILLWIVTSTFI